MKEALVTLPILGVSAAFKSAAFAEGMAVDPGLSALIGNLGVIGVLIWHLWYHTTKSQPLMLERFAAEQKEMRLAFERDKKEQQDVHERQLTRLQEMFVQTLTAFRTAVHDFRDATGAAVLQTAAATERVVQAADRAAQVAKQQ